MARNSNDPKSERYSIFLISASSISVKGTTFSYNGCEKESRVCAGFGTESLASLTIWSESGRWERNIPWSDQWTAKARKWEQGSKSVVVKCFANCIFTFATAIVLPITSKSSRYSRTNTGSDPFDLKRQFGLCASSISMERRTRARWTYQSKDACRGPWRDLLRRTYCPIAIFSPSKLGYRTRIQSSLSRSAYKNAPFKSAWSTSCAKIEAIARRTQMSSIHATGMYNST